MHRLLEKPVSVQEKIATVVTREGFSHPDRLVAMFSDRVEAIDFYEQLLRQLNHNTFVEKWRKNGTYKSTTIKSKKGDPFFQRTVIMDTSSEPPLLYRVEIKEVRVSKAF